MSVSAAASLFANVTSVAKVHSATHKKSAGLDTPSATGVVSTPASTNNLFSNLFAAVESVVGAKLGGVAGVVSSIAGGAVGAAATTGSATTAGGASAAGAAGSAAPSGGAGGTGPAADSGDVGSVAQDVRGFLHSLFAALKSDGGVGSVVNSGGDLASSLKNLIAQVQSGTSTAATSKLQASFATLLKDAGAAKAAATDGAATTNGAASANGTATTNGAAANGTAPTPTLAGVLGNLLQKVQADGGQSLKLLGSSIDASV